MLTQSQKHWRAWVTALQTRDSAVRAEALEQLTKFLDYWTLEIYVPFAVRGLLYSHTSSSGGGVGVGAGIGRETPQSESWDEVFNVDTELIRHKRSQVHIGTNEAWVWRTPSLLLFIVPVGMNV